MRGFHCFRPTRFTIDGSSWLETENLHIAPYVDAGTHLTENGMVEWFRPMGRSVREIVLDYDHCASPWEWVVWAAWIIPFCALFIYLFRVKIRRALAGCSKPQQEVTKQEN